MESENIIKISLEIVKLKSSSSGLLTHKKKF
jgi:hypothetical protein